MTEFTSKATFGKRLVASILDWVAVFIFAMPCLILWLFPSMYADMQDFASPEMDALEVAVEVGSLDTSASASASSLDSWDFFAFYSSHLLGLLRPNVCCAFKLLSKTALLVIGDFSCFGQL